MISRTSSRFWKCYRKLPKHIRKEARKAKESILSKSSLQKGTFYPSNFFFAYISKDYPAVGIQQNNQIIWFWLGSHNDYDNLLKKIRSADK